MRNEQLEYLIEISRHKSMNAAASAVHLTPQALNKAMKNLENELNMQLFERSSMGVTLTEKGERLKEIAARFFQELAELKEDDSAVFHKLLQDLTLIVPHGFCDTIFSSLLNDLYANYPNLRVTATPTEYVDIISSVENGTVPFALTYKMFLNNEDLLKDIPADMNFTSLNESKICVIAPENSPLKKYKTVSLKTLFKYPFISYTPADYLFEPIYHLYEDITPELLSAHNFSIIQTMLSNGIGATFGMYDIFRKKLIVEYPNNVIQISLKEQIHAVLGYITLKNASFSPDTLSQLKYLDYFFYKQ